MSHRDWKRQMERDVLRASSSPQQTNQINPRVAFEEEILFSFKHLDTDRSPFECDTGDGAKLLIVFDNLKKHSGYSRTTLPSRKQFHSIPEDQVRKFSLGDLESLSKSKLYQLGSQRQAERLVGYFESIRSNVLQVCFFDLEHKLSGE